MQPESFLIYGRIEGGTILGCVSQQQVDGLAVTEYSALLGVVLEISVVAFIRALLHFLVELRSCPGATDVVAGDIVTTGTWTVARPVRPGATWTACLDSALPPLEVALA